MDLFLGIDGGSTKTSAVITDENRRVIYKARGGGSNYYALGEREAEHNLYELISSILKKRDIKLSGACFGIAGVDNKKEYDRVYASVKRRLSKIIRCKFILVNDVNLILYTVNHGGKGVAVIGGTGSNFYSKNGRKESRASGLGHILSDEGGAIYIGNRVLRAAIQSFDGRGKKSVLEKLVLKKAGVKHIRDLKNIISDEGHVKSVADFAPLAEIAMKKGDSAARDILNKASEEFVKGIRAVAADSGLGRCFDVAFVGSVFKVDYLFNRIKTHVRKFAPKARFYRISESALGAARLAIMEFGKQRI